MKRMPACIIKSCQRTSRGKRTDKPRFHVFPPVKNPKFPLWLSAIGMSANEFLFVPSWRRYICSNHFTDDSYKWHLLDIPMENRKLREDAVPNLLPHTVDKVLEGFLCTCSTSSLICALNKLRKKDTEPGALRSDESSSSESEYETEFQSESEYESEYESLSTSEFSSDLDEEVTVTRPIRSHHPRADIFDTRSSAVALLRKHNSQREVHSASVDTSLLNRTVYQYPHGKGCYWKFRNAAAQSGPLGWTQPPKSGPNLQLDCSHVFRISQDSIRSITQDHRYSMQMRDRDFQSRTSQKNLQTSLFGEKCPTSQVLAAAYGNSEVSSMFSVPPSPNTASDKDSTYEPGSDGETIESLDIECNESINSIFSYEGYTQPNESLVFLSESGEFLDSSIVVEEPISDNFDIYNNLGDSQDRNALFHENVIYDESMDSCEHVIPPCNESILPEPVGSLAQEQYELPIIKRELDEMDVGNTDGNKFIGDAQFNAGNFVNVKIEFDETNSDEPGSGESAGKVKPIVPNKENGPSEIFIKCEPVDPEDSDECNVQLNEKKYVVYESCLRELLSRCIQCGALVPDPLFDHQESLLKVTMICTQGHKSHWKPQPGIPFQFSDAFG